MYIQHTFSFIADACKNSEESDLITFSNVRCGLISNYLLSDSDEICKRVVELDLVQKIKKIINLSVGKDIKSTECLMASPLSVLNVLTEQLSDLYFDSDLNLLISAILKQSTNKDLSETCLELLHYQAENGKYSRYS
jgi:hypothetical protein